MSSREVTENKGQYVAKSDNVHYVYPGAKFALPRLACEIKINGATITPDALVSILDMVTRPVPGRWYTFERTGDNVTVRQEQHGGLYPSHPIYPSNAPQANLTPLAGIQDDDC